MKKIMIVIITMWLAHAHAQNMYGTMENWRTVPVGIAPNASLTSPENWYSTDSVSFMLKFMYPNAAIRKQTFKTPDAHSGAAAVKLVTVDNDILGISSTLFTNAKIFIDFSALQPGKFDDCLVFEGGTYVSGKVHSISAWVKYLPVGNDSANIYTQAILEHKAANGGDSVIGEGNLRLGMQPFYTQVNVPITYVNGAVKPDLLRIFMTSSSDQPEENSALYVDDVSVAVTGITETVKEKPLVAVYPNPASDHITFNGLFNTAPLTVTVYAEDGRIVGREIITSAGACTFSAQPAGNYFYEVYCEQINRRQRGQFTICK